MNSIMDVNLEMYKTFYYVCELKNITKVAEMLYVTQPAITKQIKKLEECLGKELLLRTSKGIELTEDGMRLYKKIKQPIEALISTESGFKDKIDNYEVTIKIIAGHSTIKNLLLKAMTEFNKKHPQVKFEMSTSPFSTAIQKLRRSEADLIFFSEDELTEEYNDINIKPFKKLHDILVVSSKEKYQYPDKISILDLNKYKTISQTENGSTRKNIDKFFEKKGLMFIPTYELSNYWLVDEYVKLNLGIGTSIKEFVKDDLNNGSLVKIETKEEIPERQLSYATRKNCASYNIIKEFIKCIK